MPKTTQRLAPVRTVIALLIVLVWLASAAIGGPYFGRIDEVSSTDMATFLPSSAESTKVNEELMKFRDSDSIPAIIVFESSEDFGPAQTKQIGEARDAIKETGVLNGEISPAVFSEDKRAAFVVAPLDSESEFATDIPKLQAAVKDTDPTLTYKFTGPAVFAQDLNKAFSGIDGVLLLVALSVVFVILLIVYRSPVLPAIMLLSAIFALSSAILVVWYTAKADLVQLNGQVQGILFILVIGAATDYALLYISRYREELARFDGSWAATKAAWKATWEPVVAAGGTVTVGLLCLLVSDLGSNKALGPVGAIGIGFAILSGLTFLPAVLLLFGKKAFWPRVPEPAVKNTDYRDAHREWSRVGDLVGRHPRRLWVGFTVLLVVACLFIPQFKAQGVSQTDFVLGASDARDAQALLDKHFPAGSGSPVYVLAPQDKKDDIIGLIESDAGVAGVGISTNDASKPVAPVGDSAEELRQKIRQGVEAERTKQLAEVRTQIESSLSGAPDFVIDQAYSQAVSRIPSAEQIAGNANPFAGIEPKVIDDYVLLQATLKNPADSVDARETVGRLRNAIQPEYPSVMFGGVSAIQLDTNNAAEHDLAVIIPLILIAITIILMLLLRAVVAPLILLATTLLSFGATIGIAALLFNNVWHFPGTDPAVVIFGFVFLVALGIDYNIFLMTRVREETIKSGVRSGTIKALVVTGGVISSAGIVLASTFAALYVIPILFLAQIAFIVAFGVLLDTLIVRSLIVPSLTLEVGRHMWWPSKLARKR